jgi:hypothetical protein
LVCADEGVEDVQVEPISRGAEEGRPVDALKAIGHVYRVMAEAGTGEPLSMLAPYPL